MTLGTKIKVQMTQFVGQVLFRDIYPDEMTCAYVWRRGYKRWIAFLDWLFYPGHCREMYMIEKSGSQNAPEYRQ